MKFYHLTLLFALLVAIGCTSIEDAPSGVSASSLQTSDSSNPIPVMTTKKIVSDNVYIDVDMELVSRMIKAEIDPNNRLESYRKAAQKYAEDENLSRAALYRYYSNMSLIDSLWICSAKTAAELNMSERTFRYIDDNIKSMNEQAKKARAEGIEVMFPLPNPEYLIRE